MKNLLVLLLIIITSCEDSADRHPKNELQMGEFRYYVDFSPAFISASRISIVKTKQYGKIYLTVYNFRDPSLKITLSDSAILTESDFELFVNTLDTISLLTMKTDSTMKVDGVMVYNNFYQNGIKNTFFFQSPRKGSKQHKIVEAVINLSKQKFQKLKYQEYLESLEQYFDFGLPCKIISKKPFEVRIYGVLTVNEEKELKQFMNSLPIDTPIVVDMTNFEGMGTMYYSLFKSLIIRNPKIIWATKNKEQLIEIGVDSTNIVADIETARLMMH